MIKSITKEEQGQRLKILEARITDLQKQKEEIESTPLFEDTLVGQIQELEKKAQDQIQKICDKFTKETGINLCVQAPCISTVENAKKTIEKWGINLDKLEVPKRLY